MFFRQINVENIKGNVIRELVGNLVVGCGVK